MPTDQPALAIFLERFANYEAEQKKQTVLLEIILTKLQISNNNDNFEIEQDDFVLPAKVKDELKQLNEKLNNKESKQKLAKRLTLIGGSNCRLLTIRIINAIMTPDCMSSICWRGTEDKGSMMDDFKNIYDVILMVIKRRYPLTVDIGNVVEVILKNKFRNCSSKSKVKDKSVKTLKVQKAARLNPFIFKKKTC